MPMSVVPAQLQGEAEAFSVRPCAIWFPELSFETQVRPSSSFRPVLRCVCDKLSLMISDLIADQVCKMHLC